MHAGTWAPRTIVLTVLTVALGAASACGVATRREAPTLTAEPTTAAAATPEEARAGRSGATAPLPSASPGGTHTMPVVAEAQAQDPLAVPLFGDALPEAGIRLSNQPWVVRSRAVTIDVDRLRAATEPDPATRERPEIALNLFDDTSFTAVLDRVDPAPGGFTWVGHVEGLEPSSVTLAAVGSVVSGSIAYPGGVYAVQYAGNGVHEILEVDQSGFPREIDPILPAGALDAAAPAPESDPRETGGAARAARDSDALVVAGDDGSQIDLMVLYTAAAVTEAGGATAMASRINLGVSETNTSYASSGITQRLRLVHTQEVTHTDNNDLVQSLYAVSNINGPTELGNTAATLRETYKADLVMLVTAPALPNGCGVAYLMDIVSTSWAPYGFSVVWQNCISPNFTFGHELGHNMGARHDWYVDNFTTPHTYAHGYVYAPARWRTVMAYNDLCSAQGFSCSRLLSWANPAVTRDGIPMGVPGGTRSNCPTGDISNTGCDADDHRTLNETALTVSNFRQASAPCSYTVSPTSASVPAAATLQTVNVTTTIGCAWTAVSNESWITITAGSSVTGSGTVTYHVADNPGVPRTGTMTIAGQTVTINQAAAQCAYAVSPQTLSVPATASSQSVTVTTTAGCSWTATSNAGWVSITAGVSITGSGTVSFTVAANTGRVRTGTMTVAGQTVTITQASSLPTLTLSRATLLYGAINSGGTLTAQTPAQSVSVLQSGGTAVSWTASANVPWLTIAAADASGAGAGAFSVTLNNTGGTLPATGTASGTITVVAPGAQTDPTIAVQVTTYAPATTTVPFGQIDTPAQNATGVQGAIGVTGWVLDDVGVTGVKLYRNCLPFDNPASCQVVLGNNVVFIGDAVFVAGARPDVEAAYSSFPQAYRGGWGYLMLTNMLPHVPHELTYGGQGSLTLYAFATDVEGHVIQVGRSSVDTTPTTIALDNDSIAKPFGAIDTPGQGQTIGGTSYANFGWVLVRDADIMAGSGDTEIPINGSTAVVFIDGQPVAQVAYNQCRGTVGNPVPPGVYCNDDVSTIFGNPTPLPTFTPRVTNLTRYRNLDAARGAIGAFVLDTTRYANGVHSIAWGVTDSAGVTEGIGSRNFTVLNTGTGDQGPGISSITTATLSPLSRVLDTHLVAAAAPPDRQAASRVLRTASTPDPRSPIPGPADAAEVRGRVGFDLRTPLATLDSDEEGVRHVQIPELGRVELHLPGVTTGYLEANGSRRDLPPGSQLDAETGVFTWAPVAGFLGTYRLRFQSGSYPGLARDVDVTIRPITSASPADAPQIRMHLDAPAAGDTLHGPFGVAGWALDSQADIGSGIRAVHIWAQRTDVPGVAPVFLGAATLDQPRADIARDCGAPFGRAGFALVAPALAPGDYDITAYAWNERTARWEDARTARVNVR